GGDASMLLATDEDHLSLGVIGKHGLTRMEGVPLVALVLYSSSAFRLIFLLRLSLSCLAFTVIVLTCYISLITPALYLISLVVLLVYSVTIDLVCSPHA
ncbi:hypothetical protein GOODEAATRI_022635, partial [Goodea atripinnis]